MVAYCDNVDRHNLFVWYDTVLRHIQGKSECRHWILRWCISAARFDIRKKSTNKNTNDSAADTEERERKIEKATKRHTKRDFIVWKIHWMKAKVCKHTSDVFKCATGFLAHVSCSIVFITAFLCSFLSKYYHSNTQTHKRTKPHYK